MPSDPSDQEPEDRNNKDDKQAFDMRRRRNEKLLHQTALVAALEALRARIDDVPPEAINPDFVSAFATLLQKITNLLTGSAAASKPPDLKGPAQSPLSPLPDPRRQDQFLLHRPTEPATGPQAAPPARREAILQVIAEGGTIGWVLVDFKGADASETEQTPGQALQDLRLSGVLMQDGWLGLRLLCELLEAEDGLTATQLADRTSQAVDSIAPTMSLLVRYGALDVADSRFVCTDESIRILERVDAITVEPEVEVPETAQ
jgi:hypothetical protein